MHVYPIDFKTKDGNLFWTLPKRPPSPLVFDPANKLHSDFVAAMACLQATIFKVDIPSKDPRSEAFRKETALQAS